MMEKLVQFMHPEKILDFAPNLDEALIAALFGLDAATFRAMNSRFEASARETAQELLTDPSFTDRVDRLPFHPGATVVGIGDSVTDDSSRGWKSCATCSNCGGRKIGAA